MQKSYAYSLVVAAALTLLTACGGGGDSGNSNAWQTDAAGNVELKFVATTGTTPIVCGSSIKLGTTSKAVKVQDMRFYVSGVKLIKADGSKVPLKLTATDNFNYSAADGSNTVSLIDLEDKTGSCTGTAAINASIKGTVTPGAYVGAELVVGVPMALNHLNAADAATPAVLRSDVHPAMSWNWRGGRKFTKIELIKDPADTAAWANGKSGILLHLGSTGANSAATAAGGAWVNGDAVVSYKADNRLPASFAAFNPNTQKIAFDVGALFNYDIAAQDQAGAGSCMSGPTDPACVKPFAAMALGFNVDGSGNGLPLAGQSQSVLKVVGQ